MPFPLAIHSASASLVVPSSHPGTLQFISPQNQLLFDLEVAPSNRVSKRDEKDVIPASVEKIAFSDVVNGVNEWMATVEGRAGEEYEGGGETRTLKLWRWDGQRYMVNTQLPRPHNLSKVTSLSFSPLGTPTSSSSPYLLTTAEDGTAKIWQIRQTKRSDQGKTSSKKTAIYEYFWSQRSSWSYRSLAILSAAFSPDSTLIAICHGNVISLWDTETNVYLRALDLREMEAKEIAYVGEGRYLVCGGIKGLKVFDLLSCEVVRTTPEIPYTNLTAQSPGFTTTHTVASRTIISLFTPTSSAPIREIKVNQPIRSLIPLSSNLQPDQLSFAAVTQSGEIIKMGDSVAIVQYASRQIEKKDEKKLSIWQEMFGKDAFVDPSLVTAEHNLEEKQDVRQRKITGNPSAVFEGPSHTLPPMSMLFDSFFEEILALPSKPQLQTILLEEQGILYGEAEEVEDTEEEMGKKVKSREVKEEDMRELEGFFTELFKDELSGSGEQKSKKVNGVVNGHSEGDEQNGVISGSKESQVPVAEVIEEGQSDLEDEARIIVSADKLQKARKRRAPGS